MAAARIAVHGHRGARAVLPENTLEGFRYAIDAGVDYIELDITVTRDDVLVVCHDAVLKRRRCIGPSGTRVVRDLTLDELRQFDCGARRNRRFRRQAAVPGAIIPTLDDVFALRRSNDGFRFNIEVKSFPQQPRYTPSPGAYATLLVDAMRRNGVEKRVQVQSFDFRVLHEIRRLAPSIPVAALYEFGRRDFVAVARDAGSGTIGPYHRLVTRRRVERAHEAGVQVVPWTANRPLDWARLIRAGVDGIITDDPARLIEYLKKKGLR